jgi:hypothetical protein
MGQTQITVANITLSLTFDYDGSAGGTVVRQQDGVEARFSSPDCLLHLIEGLVGRRAWQAHHDQIQAAVASALRPPCA